MKPISIKEMPKKWFDLLVEICWIQSHYSNEKLMTLYLDKKLNQLNLIYTIDSVGNIIVTKGTSKTFPCVVSHMDTVHKVINNYKICFDDTKRVLFGKTSGIGGDDKCGIFSCLYFLETLPAIKVVFFTQEEHGCVGSDGIDKSFFDDCRYIIQLDRRGNNDFIDGNYSEKMVSHGFSSEVGHIKKKYGFKSATGTITDAVNLWNDGVGISCVNVSSGYLEPHSDTEYIEVDTLWNSVLFTEDIIKTLKPVRYISIKKPVTVSHINNGFYYGKYNTKKGYKKPDTYRTCVECNKIKRDDFGQMVDNQFRCYICLNKSDTHIMCMECYKYALIKELEYHKGCLNYACVACRNKLDGKQTTSIVCVSKDHDDDTLETPYIVGQSADKDVDDNIEDTDVCYTCLKVKPKKGGEYEECEGLYFTCEDCIKRGN